MAEAVDIDHDVIDFEDEYDKVDLIDDVNLNESINTRTRRVKNRIRRTEWSSMNEDERTKLVQQISFIEREQELYIMKASKTISSI